MSQALHSIVYVSVAARPFSADELSGLLKRSRERNREAGITGMLLYKSGCFLQAFEGEEKEARRLYNRIAQDHRHRNIVVLRDEAIDRREFSDWTMGFRHLNQEDVLRQPGFNEMLKMMLNHGRCSLDKSFAIKLLRSFTDNPL